MVLVVVLVAGLFLLNSRTKPPLLPADAAPAGTALPNGMKVAEGSALIGPVAQEGPDEWLALAAVTGDPIEVWRSYVGQIARLQPRPKITTSGSPGCRKDDSDGFRCDLTTAGRLRVEATMDSVPGDVSGRYLIYLKVSPGIGGKQSLELPKAGRVRGAPAPERARTEVDTGDPLAPETTAYKGDGSRYVLLKGSDLVAQWGRGSLTGGFGVLLRALPGNRLTDLAREYVDQAAQQDGATDWRHVPSEDSVVDVYRPPGRAGGYSATIWTVDQPGDDRDYIYYSLLND